MIYITAVNAQDLAKPRRLHLLVLKITVRHLEMKPSQATIAD